MRMLRWTSLALAGIAAAVLVAPLAAQEVELKPAKVKRDKYVLTAEEIAERSDITNAYDAVKLLRPNFLKTARPKGTTGAGSSSAYPSSGSGSAGSTDPYKPGGGGMEPAGSNATGPLTAVLYVDEMKQQDLERLRFVTVPEIVEIRFVSGSEATSRYGNGHEAGAILLKTKKLAKP